MADVMIGDASLIAAEGDSQQLRAVVASVLALQPRVRSASERRRAVDPAPGDAFLGLHLSHAQFDALLDRPVEPAGPPWFDADGLDERCLALLESAGLSHVDLALLFVALAPDVDRRFEWYYGYLNDDLTRKQATVALALELCDLDPRDPVARRRFSSTGPLVRHGLVSLGDVERPFLTRSLRVHESVVAHLLGDDVAGEIVAKDLSALSVDSGEAGPVSIPAEAEFVYCRTRGGAGLVELARSVAADGVVPLVIDTRRTSADAALAADRHRQAVLTGRPVVIGPIDTVDVSELRQLLDGDRRVVLTGSGPWEPVWSARTPLIIDVDVAVSGGRVALWQSVLGDDVDVVASTAELASFALDDERTIRAAETAVLRARAAGEAVDVTHLRAGARAQNTARLEALARRIEPAVGWDDLVLPPGHLDQLREIVARANHRHVVLDEWEMGRGGGRGNGIAVLFSGASGTGKTMSAEVLAAALGQDLYRIDLSTVVDKYIGETEKNLERIFTEAEHSNAVLFFDEADALFGKRSEVSDAHDRHANVEVAYLLQRMEEFAGLAILATNLRANLDEAFTRRLTALLDFPMPDADARRRLWEQCLGTKVPRGDDLDLDFWAEGFELSGGSIRNIALAAAFRAADAAGPVGMAEVAAATRQEYLKMGRLVTDQEFGLWR